MQFLCRHRDPQRHNCPSPSTSRHSAGSSSGRSRRAHSKSPCAVTTSAMSTSATGSSDAAPTAVTTARASAVSKISSSASSPLMLANSILLQLSDVESSADARTLPPRGGQRRASHRALGPARGVRGAGLKAPRFTNRDVPLKGTREILLNPAFSAQNSPIVRASSSLLLYLAQVNPAGTEFTRSFPQSSSASLCQVFGLEQSRLVQTAQAGGCAAGGGSVARS